MAVLIVDHRMDAWHSRTSTARLHGLQRRHGAAEKTTSFSLPPGIHNDGLALAHHLVIPEPHLWFDRLAHRGHMLEVIIVLRRLIRSCLPQHADSRWGRVENIDVKTLGNSPGAPGVWVG